MQKRLITGLIVVFLALAVQDGFLVPKAEPSLSADRLGSALVIGAGTHSTMPSETRVVRIIDGDTIVVLVNGVQEKIRLIGVDTPETFDSRGTPQCLGEEASNFVTSLLENQIVRLEADQSQDDRDKYGRLLRYVYLEDILINKEIIARGYGYEYTYRRPYKYQTNFRNAEQTARENQIGLWALGACKNA